MTNDRKQIKPTIMQTKDMTISYHTLGVEPKKKKMVTLNLVPQEKKKKKRCIERCYTSYTVILNQLRWKEISKKKSLRPQ